MLTVEKIAQRLIQNPASDTSILNLVKEYAQLKHKLENLDEQSWYFMKGIESNRKRLKKLESSYNSIRKDYNAKSLDDLRMLREKYKKDIKKILQCDHLSSLTRLALNSRISNVRRLNTYIAMKKHTQKLCTLDSLIGDEPS